MLIVLCVPCVLLPPLAAKECSMRTRPWPSRYTFDCCRSTMLFPSASFWVICVVCTAE